MGKKPGRLWSREERDYACEWIFSNQKHDLILLALRSFGPEAQLLDAQDALQDFFAMRFDSAIGNYMPDRGNSPIEWVKMCFRQFCYREYRKIIRIKRVEILDDCIMGKNDSTRQELEDGGLGPEGELLLKEANRTLNGCIEKLPSMYKEVFLLYREGYSEEDTVERLGISLENVKVRRKRAREKLLLCIQRGGWGICRPKESR